MRLFSNMLTFNRVKDGISTYFHVKYSRNENGNPMQDTPATYIGTVVTSDPTPPNDYKKYTWARLEGAQGKDGENGIPGHNGEDGSTSYLHIKYSDDGKTFTSNNGETPGAWIGQYVDFEPYDSPIFSRYTWKKIEGEDGKDGEDGKPGPMPVNAGQWSKDIEYIKDEFVQPYVWQIKNGKKLYYLLVAEKSKGDDPYTNNTQGNGDIWRYREEYDLFLARKIQADDIDVDNLVVRKLKSKESGPRVEIEGSIMHVYGEGMHPNMVFGVNAAGYAVMEYYTADGVKLYDLGPSGLDVINFAPVKWTEKRLNQFSTTLSRDNLTWRDFQKIILGNVTQANAPIFYTYYAGGNPTVSPEEREREKYTYASINGPKIADGWYYSPPYGNDRGYQQHPSNNSGGYIKPESDGLYDSNEGVVNRNTIYIVQCYLYVGGVITDSANYYFQEAPKGGL